MRAIISQRGAANAKTRLGRHVTGATDKWHKDPRCTLPEKPKESEEDDQGDNIPGQNSSCRRSEHINTLKQISRSSNVLFPHRSSDLKKSKVVPQFSYLDSSSGSYFSSFVRQKPSHWVIDPLNPYKLAFDVVLAVLTLYSVIYIPYRICFHLDTSITQSIVEYFVDLLFFAEIVMSFRVSYVDSQDRVVTDTRKIAQRYLRTWFLIDFFSTVPLDVVFNLVAAITNTSGSVVSLKFMKILRLLRLLKLARLFKLNKFWKKITIASVNVGILRLLKLLSQIIIVAHYLACVWYSVGLLGISTSGDDAENSAPFSSPINSGTSGFRHEFQWDSWLIRMGIDAEETPPMERYLISIYWTVATMTAVGYGDVVATNNLERAVSIVTELVGASIFGFIIGNFSSLLDSISLRDTLAKAKIAQIKEYARQRELPHSLQKQVRKYFEYFISKKSVFDESGIVSELSHTLKTKLVRELSKNTLLEIDTFRLFENQAVLEIAIRMKPVFAAAGEVIAARGETAKEMFILYEGEVEILTLNRSNGENVTIGLYTTKNYFGAISLLTDEPRKWSFRANTNSQMYSLPKEDLQFILSSYPDTERVLAECSSQKAKYLSAAKSTIAKYIKSRMASDEIEQKIYVFIDTHNKKFIELPAEIKTVFVKNWAKSVARTLKSVSRARLSMAPLRRESSFISARRFSTSSFRKTQFEEERRFMNRLFTTKYIIHPLWRPRLGWEFWAGILVIYSSIVIPYQMAFDLEATGLLVVLDLIVDITFLIDIPLNFRTAYITQDDILITSPKEITQHYLKGWFLIDFVSSVPFDRFASILYSQTESAQYYSLRIFRVMKVMRLLKLFRILKALKLLQIFNLLEDTMNFSSAGVQFFKLLTQVSFIAHYMSCGFYYFSCETGEDSWWNAYGMENSSPGELYLASFYWAVTTMTTVGYGDVIPQNTCEYAYVTLSMLIGGTVFGYIVGSMATLVGELDVQTRVWKERLSQLNEYMKEKQLSKGLRIHLRKYFEFFLSRRAIPNEDEILDELSSDLRTKILLYINSDIVCKSHFLSTQSEDALALILQELHPEFAIPEQVIYLQGDLGYDMYFVMKGTVEEVYFEEEPISGDAETVTPDPTSPSPPRLISTYLGGDHFGTRCILRVCRRQYSAQTVDYTHLFRLNRMTIRRMQSLYPNLYKAFKLSLETGRRVSINNAVDSENENENGANGRGVRHSRNRALDDDSAVFKTGDFEDDSRASLQKEDHEDRDQPLSQSGGTSTPMSALRSVNEQLAKTASSTTSMTDETVDQEVEYLNAKIDRMTVERNARILRGDSQKSESMDLLPGEDPLEEERRKLMRDMEDIRRRATDLYGGGLVGAVVARKWLARTLVTKRNRASIVSEGGRDNAEDEEDDDEDDDHRPPVEAIPRNHLSMRETAKR